MDPDRFFAEEPPPQTLPASTATIDAFVRRSIAAKRPIVLVTSGGTTVPLEQNTVRFLDNFSTGSRGSKSTEAFLERGYAVVFLHRTGSLQPFVQKYQTQHLFGDILAPADAGPGAGPAIPVELAADYERYRAAKAAGLLLDTVKFTSVTEYMYLLRASCEALAPAGANAVVYLAAAVSDYYVPTAAMAVHKIQSASGKLSLTLEPVPKMVTPLVASWCPAAFVTTFKLETDPAILAKKANAALQKYGIKLVVANILNTRATQVTLFTPFGPTVVSIAPGAATTLERLIIDALATIHAMHRGD